MKAACLDAGRCSASPGRRKKNRAGNRRGSRKTPCRISSSVMLFCVSWASQGNRSSAPGSNPRHPAVPLPEQADEEGPALIHLFQAHLQLAPVRALLPADPPTQVHFVDEYAELREGGAQSREGVAHEVVAFRLHVEERGRDEHPDRPGEATHR
jgi:hypothetical protein